MAKKKMPEDLLKWRKKQKRGAIMKPETFEEIKKKAKVSGLSEERAEKVAGKAYWQSAEAKYKKKKLLKQGKKK